MAFKSRNKDNGIEIFAVDADLSKENQEKTQNYSIPDIKSFKEQSIKVINILESKGIFLYSDDRTPGMYLNRDKPQSSKNIKNFLTGLTEQNNQQQHQIPETKTNSNTIFEFLNNIKK